MKWVSVGIGIVISGFVMWIFSHWVVFLLVRIPVFRLLSGKLFWVSELVGYIILAFPAYWTVRGFLKIMGR